MEMKNMIKTFIIIVLVFKWEDFGDDRRIMVEIDEEELISK